MRKILFSVAAGLLWAAPASADAPAFMPVQGVLASTDGTPVDGEVDIRFALYTADIGGTELWFETQSVLVEQGFFTAYLGDVTTLDLSVFRDNENVWLGVRVGTDLEMARFQVASTGFAGFAQYCGDSATLGGVAAGDFLTTSSTLSVDWANVTGVPGNLSDGDDDTTYSAGTGLTLTGTTFSADQSAIEGWAQGVCYDSSAELRSVLDTVYADVSHSHAWGSITSMPADFADGVDNDTTYTWGTLPGMPAGFSDGVDNDTLYSWATLPGIPLGFADNVDDDTTYTWATLPGIPAGFSDGVDNDTLYSWATLPGIPAGFTDNVDNDTTYASGTGLSLSSTTFSLDTAYTDGRYLNEGTSYHSISALTCAPMGSAPNPPDGLCSGGGTLRTSGGNSFPCSVGGRAATVDTYVCQIDLPSGALIEEILAYGADYDAASYMEASTWRTVDSTFAPTYYSNFAGTWQNSGLAAAPGSVSFPIFTFGTAAHAVLASNRYTIGFATMGSGVYVYGFRIRYRLV